MGWTASSIQRVSGQVSCWLHLAPRCSKTSASDISKRQISSFYLEVKQKVVKWHEGRKSVNDIAHDLGVMHLCSSVFQITLFVSILLYCNVVLTQHLVSQGGSQTSSRLFLFVFYCVLLVNLLICLLLFIVFFYVGFFSVICMCLRLLYCTVSVSQWRQQYNHVMNVFHFFMLSWWHLFHVILMPWSQYWVQYSFE